MKSQWACKKCRGKFQTMSEAKYHECKPKKFVRRPKKQKRR
jgi:hypothetical protein